MPTLQKAQLAESEPSMSEIDNRMSNGIRAIARPLLQSLGWYARWEFTIPTEDSELSQQEEEELKPIIGVLIEAAVSNLLVKDNAIIATLKSVAKKPSLIFEYQLPAGVVCVIANHYQRDDEKPGTFGLDIWGDNGSIANFHFEKPSEENIKKAAQAALARISARQSPGRPPNLATSIVASKLSTIFRASGQETSRGWQPKMYGKKLKMVEWGPFYEFLDLLLPVLNSYLREQGRPGVTVESAVRTASESFSKPRQFVPNFSH